MDDLRQAVRPLIAILAAAALSACTGQNTPAPDVRTERPEGVIDVPIDDGGTGLVGPGTGAAIGSVIGSGGGAKVAILTGLAIGYALGGSNGPRLSGMARSEHRAAMKQVLSVPIGTRLTWRAPGAHAYGTITPVREFEEEDRRCRDFEETRAVRGSTGRLTGVACEPAQR